MRAYWFVVSSNATPWNDSSHLDCNKSSWSISSFNLPLQPLGLELVNWVNPGLQRWQRSPCTLSLQTQRPFMRSQLESGTVPSGSHSQAEKKEVKTITFLVIAALSSKQHQTKVQFGILYGNLLFLISLNLSLYCFYLPF